MPLNSEQEDALSSIISWLRHGREPYFVLSGSAGTGKTFTCQELMRRHGLHICFTAPTNKAVKVLRKTMDGINGRYDFATTYSLLGLRMVADGSVKVLRAKGSLRARIGEYDLIVVDEGSMVSKVLMQHIVDAQDKADRAADRYGESPQHKRLRFLFMGDPAQLPPVGEPRSLIWDFVAEGRAQAASLRTVMRHDNQVLTLCTRLRDAIESRAVIDPDFRFPVEPDFDAAGGVRLMLPMDFRRSVRQHAKYQGGQGFMDGTSKVIAWRNARVAEHNAAIRGVLWKSAADDERFVYGERVVFAAPILDEDEVPIVHTDDEGRVLTAIKARHPQYPEYGVIVLEVELDGDGSDGERRTVRAMVLETEDQQRYNQALDDLKFQATKSGYLWREFWALKEAFHDVRYGYAITAHRAQGSTYTTAFVDMGDVLVNRNRVEAYQCFYVGCSRPSTNLVLG